MIVTSELRASEVASMIASAKTPSQKGVATKKRNSYIATRVASGASEQKVVNTLNYLVKKCSAK